MTLEDSTATLVRAVLWRNLEQQGSEYAALWQTARGWLFKGTVACVLDDQRPMLVTYNIVCDARWHTRRVAVERIVGTDTRQLLLEASDNGEWHVADQHMPAVRGCMDIDLSVTPVTNSLPIRRLNLEIGNSARVTAAWVRFPDLIIEPLSQSYRRLTHDRYAYESSTGFST